MLEKRNLSQNYMRDRELRNMESDMSDSTFIKEYGQDDNRVRQTIFLSNDDQVTRYGYNIHCVFVRSFKIKSNELNKNNIYDLTKFRLIHPDPVIQKLIFALESEVGIKQFEWRKSVLELSEKISKLLSKIKPINNDLQNRIICLYYLVEEFKNKDSELQKIDINLFEKRLPEKFKPFFSALINDLQKILFDKPNVVDGELLILTPTILGNLLTYYSGNMSCNNRGIMEIENNEIIKNVNDNHKDINDIDLKDSGWLYEIKNIISKEFDNNEFYLYDLYKYEKELRKKFPNNYNIKAKIRQQLQILRNMQYLEFNYNGKYKKSKTDKAIEYWDSDNIPKPNINLKIWDNVKPSMEKNCIIVKSFINPDIENCINCKKYNVKHPNEKIQVMIEQISTGEYDQTETHATRDSDYLKETNEYCLPDNKKRMIKYNEKLYDLKRDKSYVMLVDKKTGCIKKMFKEDMIISSSKNEAL